MISKFLSRNDEAYRVLLENEDSCWMISFENPTERPFSVTTAEMDSFQHVPAPQDFISEIGAGFLQDTAGDAGGLTPTKDDNEEMRKSGPKANTSF